MFENSKLQDVLLSSEFFSLDVADSSDDSQNQDIGDAFEASHLPVEFFQYFQVDSTPVQ